MPENGAQEGTEAPTYRDIIAQIDQLNDSVADRASEIFHRLCEHRLIQTPIHAAEYFNFSRISHSGEYIVFAYHWDNEEEVEIPTELLDYSEEQLNDYIADQIAKKTRKQAAIEEQARRVRERQFQTLLKEFGNGDNDKN